MTFFLFKIEEESKKELLAEIQYQSFFFFFFEKQFSINLITLTEVSPSHWEPYLQYKEDQDFQLCAPTTLPPGN